MGTASSAIVHLGIDQAAKQLLNSHMAVAYAITYLFGTIGSIAPLLLRVNLREPARELERQLGIARNEDAITVAYTRIVTRAHRVALQGVANGLCISELEERHPLFSLERVVRDGQVIERDPQLLLREAVGELSDWIGAEVDHPG